MKVKSLNIRHNYASTILGETVTTHQLVEQTAFCNLHENGEIHHELRLYQKGQYVLDFELDEIKEIPSQHYPIKVEAKFISLNKKHKAILFDLILTSARRYIKFKIEKTLGKGCILLTFSTPDTQMSCEIYGIHIISQSAKNLKKRGLHRIDTDTPISQVTGVGKVMLDLLSTFKIKTVGDFIAYYTKPGDKEELVDHMSEVRKWRSYHRENYLKNLHQTLVNAIEKKLYEPQPMLWEQIVTPIPEPIYKPSTEESVSVRNKEQEICRLKKKNTLLRSTLLAALDNYTILSKNIATQLTHQLKFIQLLRCEVSTYCQLVLEISSRKEDIDRMPLSKEDKKSHQHEAITQTIHVFMEKLRNAATPLEYCVNAISRDFPEASDFLHTAKESDIDWPTTHRPSFDENELSQIHEAFTQENNCLSEKLAQTKDECNSLQAVCEIVMQIKAQHDQEREAYIQLKHQLDRLIELQLLESEKEAWSPRLFLNPSPPPETRIPDDFHVMDVMQP